MHMHPFPAPGILASSGLRTGQTKLSVSAHRPPSNRKTAVWSHHPSQANWDFMPGLCHLKLWERCSPFLIASVGSFQPREVCSPGSSLVEPELTDKNDTNTSEFLQVGKVNMSCIYCLIFQGCPLGSGCKIIVDILKSSLSVCLTSQILASLVAQMIRNLPAVEETWVRSLGWEDPLEKGMATHSSVLPGEFHGPMSLAGYSPWGHKESDTTGGLTVFSSPQTEPAGWGI